MIKEFEIYSNGICFCSVCSSLSLEETTSRVNKENPTGLEQGKQIAVNAINASIPMGMGHMHYEKEMLLNELKADLDLNILFAIDDEEENCRMFKNAGITTLKVFKG